MDRATYQPTLCVGADVHLDKIVPRAVDKDPGQEVVDRFGGQHSCALPWPSFFTRLETMAITGY